MAGFFLKHPLQISHGIFFIKDIFFFTSNCYFALISKNILYLGKVMGKYFFNIEFMIKSNFTNICLH